MENAGDVKYIMKCIGCGKEFKVPNFMSQIPNHQGKGEEGKEGDTLCPGSGIKGILIGPVSN
jgi:hypothetical protein